MSQIVLENKVEILKSQSKIKHNLEIAEYKNK